MSLLRRPGEDRAAHLRRALAAHTPHDAREAAYRDQMLDLLDAGGDPFSRHHFAPGHFTASAFVLSPDRSSLLLVLHGKLHRWLQPGGHVDPGDADIFAAAQREVAEEVGLLDLPLADEAVFDLDVHEIPPLRSDPPHLHLDVRVLMVARDLAFEAGSDARAARWVPLGEVNEVESDASVMRAVEKLLRR